MDPVNGNGATNFSWAKLNPFAKADRGELSTQSQPQPKVEDTTNKDDLNPDGTKKVKTQGGESDDPLLKFDSLWQPNTDKDGKVIEDKKEGPSSYIPKVDPKKLGEMVEKMSFTNDFTEEHFAAIKEGGDKAAAAMVDMINKASRRAFTSALSASSRLAEQGFTNAQGRFTQEIPTHVRELMADNELGSNEFAQNPALKPIVDQVKQQYLKKFPKATAGEINNAVKQYFAYIASETTKASKGTEKKQSNQDALRKGDADADFMSWIESEVGEGNRVFKDDTPQQ